MTKVKEDETQKDKFRLEEALKDRVIIRIVHERNSLDVIYVFTMVKVFHRSLVTEKESMQVACISYECDFLTGTANQLHTQVPKIVFKDLINFRKTYAARILGLAQADVSVINVDFDNTKQVTENRLYLYHLVQLAKFQGMLISGCQFYTDWDRKPILEVAGRVGGLIKKHLLEMNNALTVLKKL